MRRLVEIAELLPHFYASHAFQWVQRSLGGKVAVLNFRGYVL